MLPIEPLGLSANQWQFLSAAGQVRRGQPSDPVESSCLESTRRQFFTAKRHSFAI